jgi:hypothetical protein
MLNKKEMQAFADQFMTGKVKIRKNDPIHGKADSYYAVQNEVCIQFEDSSIILKVSNVCLLTDKIQEMTPILRNYINNVNKIMEVENKHRNNLYPMHLDGPLYVELVFSIKKKKPMILILKVCSYPAIKLIPTDFGGMIIDLPLMIYRSYDLIVNIESNKKIVKSDLSVFNLPVIREIIDFNDVLDEVFIDQLNTLEMALL